MASESDRLLIQQIRQGEPNAWQDLIARYEGRLLAFVDRRLHDRAASEDVVQETFVGFLTSLPSFDERRELQTYLFTIASHKLIDHLRRTGRRLRLTAADGAGDLLGQQRDEGPAASSVARGRERRGLEAAVLVRCLGQMLRQWQERGDFLRLKILELLLVKGWANRDVARALQLGEQQVANYRFAAIKKLTEAVRDAGLPVDVFPGLREENV